MGFRYVAEGVSFVHSLDIKEIIMLHEAKNFVVAVGRGVISFQTFLTALTVAVVMSVCSIASAQSPVPINVNVPDFDYAGVATQILALIAIPIAAAIGIGLSFIAIRWIYRMFKGMAK
jgi:hypothetical protein